MSDSGRKFLVGMLVGAVLVGVGIPVLVAIVFAITSGPPAVPQDTALVVGLSGAIPEHVTTDVPPFFRGDADSGSVALFPLTEAIRRAAEDDRVKALVLRGRGSRSGWAKAQEMRWAIQDFKKSGKPVWAFLEVAGREDYYIASLADRIVIQPESFLDLKGLRLEVMYFKGSLEKLGIEADLIRAGRYKSAGEAFSREDMSPDTRVALNALLDSFFAQLLEGIAEGRGQDAGHWQGVLDEGPFPSQAALEHGLIDDVLHQDAFFEALDEAAGVEELNRISDADYTARALRDDGRGTQIAVLHAIGTIRSGSSRSDPFDGMLETLGSDTFTSEVERLREDDGVKGVILRIDSPGGDAIASEQMLRAVRRLGDKKPLVVSMSTMAASGGYYIAAAPEVPIVAYPGTYTGSIGVFTIMLNLRDLYNKLGVTKDMLSRGQFAAIDSDYKAMSPAERAKLAAFIETFYETFLARVAEGRGVEVDEIRDIAEGRVWIGDQALANGLVDEMGGYGKAIAMVKEAAEIEEGATVRIVHYPPRKSMLEAMLSGGPFSVAPEWSRAPLLDNVREAWESVARGLPSVQGGAMYMSPYVVSVD